MRTPPDLESLCQTLQLLHRKLSPSAMARDWQSGALEAEWQKHLRKACEEAGDTTCSDAGYPATCLVLLEQHLLPSHKVRTRTRPHAPVMASRSAVYNSIDTLESPVHRCHAVRSQTRGQASGTSGPPTCASTLGAAT